MRLAKIYTRQPVLGRSELAEYQRETFFLPPDHLAINASNEPPLLFQWYLDMSVDEAVAEINDALNYQPVSPAVQAVYDKQRTLLEMATALASGICRDKGITTSPAADHSDKDFRPDK
jgi:hypothetical protein